MAAGGIRVKQNMVISHQRMSSGRRDQAETKIMEGEKATAETKTVGPEEELRSRLSDTSSCVAQGSAR